MPYREENSDPFVSDVFGRIMISIMPGATSRTFPETIREQKFLIAMTTVRTQLRRWKPATNEDKVSVAPSGFVFDLPEDLTMRGVVNRPGKLGFDMPLRFSISHATHNEQAPPLVWRSDQF